MVAQSSAASIQVSTPGARIHASFHISTTTSCIVQTTLTTSARIPLIVQEEYSQGTYGFPGGRANAWSTLASLARSDTERQAGAAHIATRGGGHQKSSNAGIRFSSTAKKSMSKPRLLRFVTLGRPGILVHQAKDQDSSVPRYYCVHKTEKGYGVKILRIPPLIPGTWLRLVRSSFRIRDYARAWRASQLDTRYDVQP